jgi:DNA-binding GntR family transcriptional regulator
MRRTESNSTARQGIADARSTGRRGAAKPRSATAAKSAKAGKKEPKAAEESHPDSFVDRAYEQLKNRAINFGFRPGERLNEMEICKLIGVSRTPLREALHRLNTEGFLKFIPGKGFFCRDLDPKEIYDLYELRKVIEVAAVRIAAARAEPEEVDELERIQERLNAVAGTSMSRLMQEDERFHEHLMEMSGNHEMLRVLRNLNARTRFVRGFDGANHQRKAREHQVLIRMLREGDSDGCARTLEKHIELRLDQIMDTIKESIAKIYLPMQFIDA